MAYIPNPKHVIYDFYSVPETGDVPVNRNGEILIFKDDGYRITRGEKGQYYRYGKKQVHRIVAMTFLSCDSDPSDMIINHKDGNKHNNHIDNLEWCDYKRNIDHAYESGLRTDNKNIEIKNLETGEIKSFYSIQECARYLKHEASNIIYYARGKRDRPFLGKYDVKYPGYEWSELSSSDVIPGIAERSNRRFIYAKAVNPDDRDYVFSSMPRVIEVFSSEFMVRKSIKTGCVYRDYRFYYLREYTKDKKLLKRIMKNSYLHLDQSLKKKNLVFHPTQYRITTPEGQVVTVGGLDEVRRTIGYENKVDSLSRFLYKNNGAWNGYKVEIVKRATRSAINSSNCGKS